jgi:alpha,alpha-trehalose phosphorylase
VIGDDAFDVAPWVLCETRLHLDRLAQCESVFALSNGHIGLRGNLDEGEPAGLLGTYLNGFYEVRPLPYAEAGYGYPEQGQTVVNVTDGKLLRLLVDDELFDVRYGQLERHVRTLDLRAGTLERDLIWRSPAGDRVRVRSVRLVSFVQRSIAAVEYSVEPLEGDVRLVVQSDLVANEPLPPQSDDPRAAAALEAPLIAEAAWSHGLRASLAHRTRASGLRMAAAMDHEVQAPEGTATTIRAEGDLARLTVSAEVGLGDRLRIVKYLGYGWSSRRSLPSVLGQVEAALASARRTGWNRLAEGQREYLDAFWSGADVELEGDDELQQALRFGLFQVLQAGARAEARAIAAKGLTGPGYDGHTFWDTETYVLPVLTYTASDAAADALRWRHSTLDLARERALKLHVAGAAFPWRTIRGQETSAYWPAGTAAFHVNADVAAAVESYLQVTEDGRFAREVGLEIAVETARLWRALGHHEPAAGTFEIDGVTGPDEYSALADNNVYTNLMAARNLRLAARLAEAHPEVAEGLGVSRDEIAAWRRLAEDTVVPYDAGRGLHPQADRFLEHRRPDFESLGPEVYPLLLTMPYFELYRTQVVKQADLALALYLCSPAFTPEQRMRDFEYYEGVTVRDSSLSAGVQAVMAAETGHLQLALDYLAEAALIDLDDRQHNTRDGLHLASLASSWLAVVAGFGGLRELEGRLHFAPRLPPGLSRVTFRLRFRGRRLRVAIAPDRARYELHEGDRLEIVHHGGLLVVEAGGREAPIPPLEPRPEPAQPRGRRPLRRTPPGSQRSQGGTRPIAR